MIIEKSRDYQVYKRKITSYIDGSLSPEETSEFEAFVSLNPEFQFEVDKKKQEIELLKTMMPQVELSSEEQEALEEEMKASIFNLIQEKPEGFLDSIRIKWENRFNR